MASGSSEFAGVLAGAAGTGSKKDDTLAALHSYYNTVRKSVRSLSHKISTHHKALKKAPKKLKTKINKVLGEMKSARRGDREVITGIHAAIKGARAGKHSAVKTAKMIKSLGGPKGLRGHHIEALLGRKPKTALPKRPPKR